MIICKFRPKIASTIDACLFVPETQKAAHKLKVETQEVVERQGLDVAGNEPPSQSIPGVRNCPETVGHTVSGRQSGRSTKLDV